jgi:hypothetical protein
MATKNTSTKTTAAAAINATRTRHVRLKMPDRTYRALRHRLADATDGTTISDVVVAIVHEHLVLEGYVG